MKRIISAKLAANILLLAMGLVAIFDVLVLLGIVPSDIVWGGQIRDSATNRVLLELVALLVAAIFAVIIAAKIGYLEARRFRKAVTVGVWIIFAFFILNTIGNLASGASFERLIFAPITVVLALCALRLAIEAEQSIEKPSV